MESRELPNGIRVYCRTIRWVFAAFTIAMLIVAACAGRTLAFITNIAVHSVFYLVLCLPPNIRDVGRLRRPAAIFVDRRGDAYFYFPRCQRLGTSGVVQFPDQPTLWNSLETMLLGVSVTILVIGVCIANFSSGSVVSWFDSYYIIALLALYVPLVLSFRLDRRWFPRIYEYGSIRPVGDRIGAPPPPAPPAV
jgi:hypothetical protein